MVGEKLQALVQQWRKEGESLIRHGSIVGYLPFHHTIPVSPSSLFVYLVEGKERICWCLPAVEDGGEHPPFGRMCGYPTLTRYHSHHLLALSVPCRLIASVYTNSIATVIFIILFLILLFLFSRSFPLPLSLSLLSMTYK